MEADDEIRILHVDDEPSYAQTTAEFLETEDERFVVETATDADAGLAALRSESFDCVVSDYEMPETDGIEFLRAVRDDHPELPFVLFTGRGSESVASEAIAAGVTDYLQKGGTEAYTILANRVGNAVEARRSARRAERHRHRLDQVVKTIPGCVMRVDLDGEISYINERIEDIFGFRPEEMLGRQYDDSAWEAEYLDGTPVPDEEVAFKRIVASERPLYGLRRTALWPDGKRRAFLLNGAPVFEDGEMDSVVFSFVPIDDRVDREQTLAAFHEVAADLSACSTPEAVCERTIEASQELLAFDVSEVSTASDGVLRTVAKTGDSIWEPTSIEEGVAGRVYRTGESEIVDELANTETAIEPGPYRSTLTVPVGEQGVFQVLSEQPAAFDDEDRELAELLVSHTANALERLERERELERQNDRLEEFTSVVSHDLRTPLTVAAGHLDLATRECDSDHLDAVEDALDRSERLISDLLALAREGQRAVERESVAVAEVVDACWTSLAGEEATLAVETDRTIEADPSKFRQLIENLLSNAVEHGGPGVTIRVGHTPGALVVADDGPGVPADERDRIFDPGHSTAEAGTGFGLTIVDQIASAHGWEVRVADSEGGGARVELTGVQWVE